MMGGRHASNMAIPVLLAISNHFQHHHEETETDETAVCGTLGFQNFNSASVWLTGYVCRRIMTVSLVNFTHQRVFYYDYKLTSWTTLWSAECSTQFASRGATNTAVLADGKSFEDDWTVSYGS